MEELSKESQSMDAAIDHARNGTLEFFQEAPPDLLLNARDSDGNTVLSIVVRGKHVDCCKEICKKCPSLLTMTDNQGQNFFHHAVNSKRVNMVKHILGMEEITEEVLNSKDNLGRTPWDVAAESRKENIISCLLENDEVVKKIIGTENLHWVVEKHNYKMIKKLLEKGIDLLKNIELKVIEGSKDILFKAAGEKDFLMCEKLYERCPLLIYHRNKVRRTALHQAAIKGEPKMLEFLIAAGEKISQKLLMMVDDKGQTALHMAVLKNKVVALDLLVKADSNKELLRAGDLKKNTALHLAVGEKPDKDIASSLIKADPDFPYDANSDGKTPLFIAIDKAESHNADREMLKLILKLQPTQSMVSVNENRWTALHYCVFGKYFSTIVEIIQSCPGSSKVGDNEGQNFFHQAVKSGNVKMVKDILGMEEITEEVLNSPDNSGRTPWDVAAESQNESMISCLHKDDRVNKKLSVTKNLNWVVEKHNIVMLEFFMRENVDFLMNIEEKVFLNSKNEEEETILFKAAQEKQSLLCAKLCERCPSLVRHKSKGGRTVLHHAAFGGSLIVLPVLIKACRSPHEVNLRDHSLMIVDDQGDTALHMAVRNHKLEAVKLLVEAGSDFDYDANSYEDTPIMISVREARLNENKFDTGEIRRLLFKMQPRQTMAHRGEKGWTSLLHQATSEEDLSIIEDIIKFCTGYLDVEDDNGKNFLHIAVELGKIEVVRLVLSAKYIIKLTRCLEQLDNEGKNFLHIAAELGKVEVVRLVLRVKDIIMLRSCLEQLDKEDKNFLHVAAEFEKVDIVKQVLRVKNIPKEGVLDKKDKYGNTPFHIAALTGNEPLTRCFLFHPTVNKDTVNKEKQHVLSAIKFSYDKRKAKVDRIAHTVDQSELKDQSDFDLVVGALIATVSFAAGITVPGGYISDGPNQGTAVFSKRVSFASFTISNTFALVFSLFAVFSHFCARRLRDDADILSQLKVATCCTLAAIYCMMAAFIAGSFAVLANSNWLAILVCTISCLFFIFAFHPIWKLAKQHKLVACAGQHKCCICFGFF